MFYVCQKQQRVQQTDRTVDSPSQRGIFLFARLLQTTKRRNKINLHATLKKDGMDDEIWNYVKIEMGQNKFLYVFVAQDAEEAHAAT